MHPARFPYHKPFRGIQINWAHPLARGLVGVWLMNEGTGNKIYDLSGNQHIGTFENTPTWEPDRIDFVSTGDDRINIGDKDTLDPRSNKQKQDNYKDKRRIAYPNILDQLEMIYNDKKNGTDTFVKALDDVKIMYPKEVI